MTGAAGGSDAQFCIGACWAKYIARKSHHRLNVSGSSESTWVPFVNVNHFRSVPLKCSARVGQWPPVCSSVNWQAMYVGTLILLTNVIGASGSATLGL